jgi:hypothetical protein
MFGQVHPCLEFGKEETTMLSRAEFGGLHGKLPFRTAALHKDHLSHPTFSELAMDMIVAKHNLTGFPTDDTGNLLGVSEGTDLECLRLIVLYSLRL